MPDINDTPLIRTKLCSKCHNAFPATTQYFYKQARRLTSACRTCSSAIQKAKRLADPETYRSYDRSRYEKDPEKHRASARRDAARYPARRAASNKKWRAENRAYLNRYQRNQYHANPEQSALVRVTKKARRRAAQQHTAINDLTPKQWQQVKAHYRYRCVYCGKKPTHLEMDHITPIRHGGNHTMSNVVPACRFCNRSKGTKGVPTPIQPLLLL